MPARVYRVGGAAPGVILGLLPAAAGLFIGSAPATAFGAVMTASAAGDLVVLWLLRGLPDHTLVRDHPTRVGCEILDGTDPGPGAG